MNFFKFFASSAALFALCACDGNEFVLAFNTQNVPPQTYYLETSLNAILPATVGALCIVLLLGLISRKVGQDAWWLKFLLLLGVLLVADPRRASSSGCSVLLSAPDGRLF